MQIHRNEACPCGSGQKYKRCCAGKEALEPAQRGASRPLLAVLALLILGGLGYALFAPASPEPTQAAEGPAPGRVWCEAHGAWHDGPH